jgi:hypothetical protein
VWQPAQKFNRFSGLTGISEIAILKLTQPMLAEAYSYSFTFMFPGVRVIGAIAAIIILAVWLVCILIRRR